MENTQNNDNYLPIILSERCPPRKKDSSDSVKNSDKNRLIIASIVCLAIMITEMVGGIVSNSLAVITDAAHLLTDFGAFMVSLLSIWISTKSRTQKMNFGYHRAEVIGALISVLSIWLITGILLYLAIERLRYQNFEIDAFLMLIVAVLAIVANLILAFALLCHKDCLKSLVTPRKFGINVKSAVIHVFGDLLHGIGVLIASLIIYFKPEYKIADPICTFIFSFVVLCTTLKILKDILTVLMEGVPSHISFNDIRKVLFSIPEIVKVHNLRLWSLTMDKVALAAHIVIREGTNPTCVLKKSVQKISKEFDIYEMTLQIEEDGVLMSVGSSSDT
ncbi:proton-coupled zinc antiporter SLC30A8-like [Parasteatoda tepidariorum]|uniref:proton-coupled zinc antiporter SLC30A8-like n=1 Tax=Parasteatoda tepidariorum TaxID=114398 RepID=UPI001C718A07|nr:zinc transporter 8-like [Parasteatoda tepidariorum]